MPLNSQHQISDLLATIMHSTRHLLAEVDGTLNEDQRDDLQEVHQGNTRLEYVLNCVFSETWQTESLLHDLRSPLNIIIGYSELLLDDTTSELNDVQYSRLRALHSDALVLAEIIGDYFNGKG